MSYILSTQTTGHHLKRWIQDHIQTGERTRFRFRTKVVYQTHGWVDFLQNLSPSLCGTGSISPDVQTVLLYRDGLT